MGYVTYHVDVNGKRYLVNDQNQLIDQAHWDPDIRDWLAEQVGLQLSEEHIAAVDFIRSTYQRRKQHPMVRVIAAYLADTFGPEKGSLRHFYALFPKGVHQAVTIAGVPLKGLCF